jgi:ubiquinone/menaquinone biosynthesis C-methylase UbiE
MARAVTAHTNRARSYQAPQPGRDFDRELERLRNQAELGWATERRKLAALGVRDGQYILEPGCGPGFITERLLSWLPSSRIVALDADPRMLAVATRTLSGISGDRATLLQAELSDTGLPGDSFDVVISRYLFQHLEDPVAAAAALLRLLKPGGFHVVIDVDDGLWGLAEPYVPEFAGWYARRARAQGQRGGNRFIGRRLGRILRQAGYANVAVDLFCLDSDELGIDRFKPHLAPEQFLPLLQEGSMTFAEYIRAWSLYNRFLAAGDPLILSAGFLVYAEKPL